MKSNNPNGRPNVLVDPVRITITIEQRILTEIDAIITRSGKNTTGRSHVIRILLKDALTEP